MIRVSNGIHSESILFKLWIHIVCCLTCSTTKASIEIKSSLMLPTPIFFEKKNCHCSKRNWIDEYWISIKKISIKWVYILFSNDFLLLNRVTSSFVPSIFFFHSTIFEIYTTHWREEKKVTTKLWWKRNDCNAHCATMHQMWDHSMVQEKCAAPKPVSKCENV